MFLCPQSWEELILTDRALSFLRLHHREWLLSPALQPLGSCTECSRVLLLLLQPD